MQSKGDASQAATPSAPESSINRVDSGFELGKTGRHKVPIQNLLYGFDVIRAAILIFEIVSVFPHINAKQRQPAC